MIKKSVLFTPSQIILNLVVLLSVMLILYPFLYCLSYSLSDSSAVMLKNVVLFPIDFTFYNYTQVFARGNLLYAAGISVARTVLGIIWALSITTLAAYAVSKKYLPGRHFFNIFFIIPMYISGGLIPQYILYSKIHLFNNFLVYILPHGFYAFNMLLIKTYFDSIPDSLEESAMIDGARYFTVFIRIILPVSSPILAVMAMFIGVWQWNSWFDVVLYVSDSRLFPLQTILQRMLEESMTTATQLVGGGISSNSRSVSPESLRMATLIITTLPIVMIYPFFQKYFVTGIMVGSVKG